MPRWGSRERDGQLPLDGPPSPLGDSWTSEEPHCFSFFYRRAQALLTSKFRRRLSRQQEKRRRRHKRRLLLHRQVSFTPLSQKFLSSPCFLTVNGYGLEVELLIRGLPLST